VKSFLPALAVATALAFPAQAAGTPEAFAETAVNFFERTCLGHFRDRAGLEAKVSEGGPWHLPVMKGGLEQVFLGGAPGKAWLLKEGDGIFALALREDGTCSVFARRADEIRVLEKVDALLKGGFFTGQEVDSDHKTVFTRRYYDVTAGAETLKMVVSTTREPGAQFQAAFSVAPPGAPAHPPEIGR
jgi:hypothetical protein